MSSKQSEYNLALQDLAEAGHDVIEAEQEGSGQGSWGRAMVWQVFKDKYAAAKAAEHG